MSVKNGFGGLGDLNDIRDPIADAAEMSVVVSLGGAIVLEGAGTLILMNGGRSLVNEGLQNYAVWRATTRGTISAADKVAIHEALTSALGQASALMAPYSATIQVEVQIAALAGAQISRQVAIVGSTVIRP